VDPDVGKDEEDRSHAPPEVVINLLIEDLLVE
jgi:hypothetical protein